MRYSWRSFFGRKVTILGRTLSVRTIKESQLGDEFDTLHNKFIELESHAPINGWRQCRCVQPYITLRVGKHVVALERKTKWVPAEWNANGEFQ